MAMENGKGGEERGALELNLFFLLLFVFGAKRRKKLPSFFRLVCVCICIYGRVCVCVCFLLLG